MKQNRRQAHIALFTSFGGAKMNLVSQIFFRLRTNVPRTIELGGHSVSLPAGHLLDWYRLRHSRYDEPIADLCDILIKKYPNFRAIDIGANIGDTAALIVRSSDVSVLCVEGNQKYLPLLKKNLAHISVTSEIEETYVGFDDGEIAGHVVTRAGTASIEPAVSGQTGTAAVRMRSLESIVADHPRFLKAELLKIDTDGFDAKIIMASIDLISRVMPVVYVEYSPNGSPHVEQECREMINRLCDIGYIYFHIFDNFGNHILRLSFNELFHLNELIAYVRNCRKDLRPAVFYFDICAITNDNSDISDELLRKYLVS